MSNLVIVESPTKAKTIGKFLPHEFIVKSSFGHVRDLPKKEMGVDIDNDFTPSYVIPKEKQKTVTELKKSASRATLIYFATDSDREGEAIAWHLREVLKPKPAKVKRITFHEITKHAIEKALANPRDLDMRLVDAQQARRILDRLVGYELSPFLWKKVARGLSAGRVQSVAVRLIVERERERQNFKTREYWTIEAIFKKSDAKRHPEPPKGVRDPVDKRWDSIAPPAAADPSSLDAKNLPSGFFVAKLHAVNNETLDKFALKDEKASGDIIAALSGANYKVAGIESKKTSKTPPPPFTTSTLQQEANRKLGFSAKQTMRQAQELYENGYITYMRTDSVALSEKFLNEARAFLQKNYGAKYALPSPRHYKTKARTAQEAHEAIRPTEAGQTPDGLKGALTPALYRLYNLIWRRAVATQMPEAILNNVAVDVETKTNKTYMFRATGQTIVFDGWLKIYPALARETILPTLEKDETVDLAKLDPLQHFTEPPARYSDATLVKALEEFEIGRPSTYAPTINTIIVRNYVERDENKRLAPKEIAFLVNDILVEHFPKIVDYKFTAKMENDLDDIAEGKVDWVEAIDEFYKPFKKNLMEKTDTLTKKELTEEKTEEKCDKCGKAMVIKMGRFGRFLACTGWPDCKNTKPVNHNGEIEAPETTEEKCPECGSPMQVKHGRFGKFLSCSRYPECKGIKRIEKTVGVKCPECGQGEIVEKRSKRGKTFYACNRYPDCKTAFFSKPVNEKCPDCGAQLVFGPKGTYQCSSKECKFSKKAG